VAYREHGMWEILEVLRGLHRGDPQRRVARATGHGRATVARWLATAQGLGWEPGGEAEPDEALARAVGQTHRPRAATVPPGESEARLRPHRDRVRVWLASDEGGQRGLRLSKVHQLLARQGVEVPYSSLHRFAVTHCGFHDRRRVTVRLPEVTPGEVAEVDFGKLGLVWDPEAGRRRNLHALIVILVHSRHQFVYTTFSQKLPDLIAGLEAAWEFFGGVARRAILDNLKAAVTKADRYEPLFQRTFAEYAAYRGFVIDAAIVRHPTGKPHVERQVQYVREGFFRGESWINRDHVQREAERWCLETAGPRIHGTTRQRPIEVFEAVEKPALLALERPPYDPPTWAEAKVHPDHHVQFQKAFYSAPTRHVGKQAWVRGDTKLIRIFVGDELVATHSRVKEGKRSTFHVHYPPERADYAMRDVDRILRQARAQGPRIGRFMARLLAGDFPWSRLRQAQKLLRLCQKYGAKRLDEACGRALAFDLLNVKRVEGIVLGGLAAPPPDPDEPAQILLHPRYARDPDHFNHHEPKETDHGDHDLSQTNPETPEALGTARDPARTRGVREEDEAR